MPPYYVDEDYPAVGQQDQESLNLSLNEAVDMAQNRPLWRMMSTFGATRS